MIAPTPSSHSPGTSFAPFHHPYRHQGSAHAASTLVPTQRMPLAGVLGAARVGGRGGTTTTTTSDGGGGSSTGADSSGQAGDGGGPTLAGGITLPGSPGGRIPGKGLAGCHLLLQARDKMGNVCHTGGANVTCGCRSSPEVASGCIDHGDGTYSLVWRAPKSGAYACFVKIDGYHVCGSPLELSLSAKEATPPPRRSGSHRRGRESSREPSPQTQRAPPQPPPSHRAPPQPPPSHRAPSHPPSSQRASSHALLAPTAKLPHGKGSASSWRQTPAMPAPSVPAPPLLAAAAAVGSVPLAVEDVEPEEAMQLGHATDAGARLSHDAGLPAEERGHDAGGRTSGNGKERVLQMLEA